MTNQDWDLDKITARKIAEHLEKEHSFGFNDRRAISMDDFMFEHFPCIMRAMQDEGYGFLDEQGKKDISKARKHLRESLKYCEENQIPIIKVYDFNENDEGEWRICKPTQEQVDYLKNHRWFKSAEGYFNKAILQNQMLSETDLDLMLNDLKETIIEKQEQRILLKSKK